MPKLKKEGTEEVEKEVCFVIMPFGSFFDRYYEEIYKVAIENAGLSPHRADDLYGPNNVVSDIWEYTNKAKIVLADLTGKNPNVFYELGLAHALPRPVILVSDSDQDIPFDLKAIRFIRYDKNEPDWGDRLKKSIVSSIKEILKNPGKYIPAPFLRVKEGGHISPVTSQEKELIEIKQDLNLLKKEVYIQTHPSKNISERISRSTAQRMVDDYVKRGAPNSYIFDKLSRFGVPSSWLSDEIERAKARVTPPLSDF